MPQSLLSPTYQSYQSTYLSFTYLPLLIYLPTYHYQTNIYLPLPIYLPITTLTSYCLSTYLPSFSYPPIITYEWWWAHSSHIWGLNVINKVGSRVKELLQRSHLFWTLSPFTPTPPSSDLFIYLFNFLWRKFVIFYI